jgi:hypothetical protein
MVKDSKTNRLGLVSGMTGGHNVTHDTNTGRSEVKVPPAKAEAPLGLAKASPAFKKVEPKAKAEKKDEEKALAENEIKTEAKVIDNTPPAAS